MPGFSQGAFYFFEISSIHRQFGEYMAGVGIRQTPYRHRTLQVWAYLRGSMGVKNGHWEWATHDRIGMHRLTGRLPLLGVGLLLIVIGLGRVAVLDPAWRVVTFAGDGVMGWRDGPRNQARFNWPTDVVVGPDWRVYVADFGNNVIRVISAQGEVTTLAGSGNEGFADGVGSMARFNGPNGMTMGPDGALYVADAGNARIRRVGLDGTVTTVAGSGIRGILNGPAKTARFGYPTGVAFDQKGLMYVVDRWANMVRVMTPDGMVGTLAGDGNAGLRDGPGPVARFDSPLSAVWDTHWGLLVTDSGNHAVRRVGPTAMVTTLVGGPEPGNMDGPPDLAAFFWDTGLVGDGRGGIYVTDAHNHRIRYMDPDRQVTTVAGSGLEGGRDGPALQASFAFITGIARDPAGNLLVADSGAHRIRWVVKGEARSVSLGPKAAIAGLLTNPADWSHR